VNAARPNSQVTRIVPAIAAAALLGTVVIAGVVGGSSPGPDVPSAGSGSADTTAPVSVVTQPAVVVVETTAPVVKVPLDRTLANGVAGDDVTRVQTRLKDLGFAPGGIDGIYGPLTIQAVWAFEKLVMGTPSDEATGRVTPEMWDRMQDPIRIQPRRPTGGQADHTEIYLPEQVLAVFHADVPVFVAHISSGDNREWCEEVTISPGEIGNEKGTEPIKRGECGRSYTPGGVFEFERRVEGTRQSSLGGMLNPVYFNYGIAVHGAYNVPLHPASHGCIRIANDLSKTFFGLVELGDRVLVWNGEEEPEQVSERDRQPVWNWRDPDYTTTTTSTTTTTTTTLAPATTVATATTTTTPPATTTAVPTSTSTTTIPAVPLD
jgi:peptidoglycan hydrolase-like protein with peptidoglycan-binding domain